MGGGPGSSTSSGRGARRPHNSYELVRVVRVRIILGNRCGKTRTSVGTSLEHNSTFVNSSHRGVGERAVSAVSSTIDRQSPTQYPSTTYSTRFPIPPGNPRQLYIYIYLFAATSVVGPSKECVCSDIMLIALRCYLLVDRA